MTTTIGSKPQSFIRSWQDERPIYEIMFYNSKGEIVAKSRASWLSANPKFNDVSSYDIQSVTVTKEVKHYKANYNLEKAMANKCHFIINRVKEYSYDDPTCDLYLYVSDEDDKEADFILESVTTHKKLYMYNLTESKITYYSQAVIKTVNATFQGRTEIEPRAYLEFVTDSKTIKNFKYENKINTMIDEFKKLGIYNIESKTISQLLSNFTLEPREIPLALQEAGKIIEEYGKMDEISLL